MSILILSLYCFHFSVYKLKKFNFQTKHHLHLCDSVLCHTIYVWYFYLLIIYYIFLFIKLSVIWLMKTSTLITIMQVINLDLSFDFFTKSDPWCEDIFLFILVLNQFYHQFLWGHKFYSFVVLNCSKI